MIKLSVVILSYNTKDITKDCLEKLYKSLSNASFQSEIIIIDNASVDGSQEMISQSKKIFAKRNVTFKTIFNQQNEGYPKGNNRGFHNATGEYILFLNSELNFSGIFFTFLRSKDRTIEDAPIKINESPVIVTREIPDVKGFTISMKEKITPNTLKIAAFPQLRIPKLFISKENPIR